MGRWWRDAGSENAYWRLDGVDLYEVSPWFEHMLGQWVLVALMALGEIFVLEGRMFWPDQPGPKPGSILRGSLRRRE